MATETSTDRGRAGGAAGVEPLPSAPMGDGGNGGNGNGEQKRQSRRTRREKQEIGIPSSFWLILLGVAAYWGVYLFLVNYGGTSESFREVLAHPGFVTALVAIFYMLVLLVSRWLLIARPYRIALEADVEKVRARAEAAAIRAEEAEDETIPMGVVEELLDDADRHLDYSDSLLWSWGDQKAAMQLVAEADRMLAGDLTPVEARIRLDVVTAEIDQFAAIDPAAGTANQRLLAEAAATERRLDPRWADLSESVNEEATPGVVEEGFRTSGRLAQRFRILYSNALELLHRLQIDEFARILKWHRKVLWLTIAGLVLVVVLAATLGNPQLLLLGAAGAYLARLTRIIRRADAQPEDTSSYWTNLLLGPLLGALAAYGGILLIEFLQQLDVLGESLVGVGFDLSDPATNLKLTYGLAFLFGISEGLINKVSGIGASQITRSDPSDLAAATSRTGAPEVALVPVNDGDGGEPPSRQEGGG